MNNKQEIKLIRKEIRLDIKAKELTKKQAEYNRLITKIVVRENALKETIKLLKAGNNFSKAIIKPGSGYVAKDGRLDIIISDLHYSGKSDDKQVNAFMKAQITKLKKNWTGQKVRLVFLGDDIEGELHLSSLDKHQEQNTVNQIVGVSRHYNKLIHSVVEIIGAKKLEVAFVPESNHGQLRLHGMTRGQQPRNDVGYVILNNLMMAAPTGVKFWANKDGIVETNDTFYMHGDKGYMKSADKVRLVLGSVKHIVMGHWHSFKVSQHGAQYLIVAPKATGNHETYAKEAGYAETTAAALWIKNNNKGVVSGWEMVEVA